MKNGWKLSFQITAPASRRPFRRLFFNLLSVMESVMGLDLDSRSPTKSSRTMAVTYALIEDMGQEQHSRSRCRLPSRRNPSCCHRQVRYAPLADLVPSRRPIGPSAATARAYGGSRL